MTAITAVRDGGHGRTTTMRDTLKLRMGFALAWESIFGSRETQAEGETPCSLLTCIVLVAYLQHGEQCRVNS